MAETEILFAYDARIDCPPGLVDMPSDRRRRFATAAMAALAWLYLLDVGYATHRDAAAAHEVGIADPLSHQHFAAGGKVGAGHQLQQLFVAQIGFAH